jgi:hypothetical protein
MQKQLILRNFMRNNPSTRNMVYVGEAILVIGVLLIFYFVLGSDKSVNEYDQGIGAITDIQTNKGGGGAVMVSWGK